MNFPRSLFVWAVLLALSMGVVGPHNGLNAAPEHPKSLIFEDVIHLIKDRYVDEGKTKDDLLMEGAIKGMVDTLDRHSAYLDPKARKELNVETTGSFGGLGVEISVERGRLLVVSPIEETPAHRAGLQTGDHISAIDGESTEEWTVDQAITKLRGPAGAKVVLTIEREGLDEPFDVPIVRDIIKIQTIKSFVIKQDVGYVRLRNFAETSTEDLKRAIQDLLNQGVKSLVLDLRNNPGGLLHVAVDIASQFIQAGKTIVSTRGRMPQMNSEMFSSGGAWADSQFPLIVLVNKGSASASEIVTGAVKDHGRGLIVGSKTFGKGSVQSIFELPGGAGLKLTTAHYYTPAGILIHEKGIEPDVQVAEKTSGKVFLDLFRKDMFSGFSEAYLKRHHDARFPFVLTDRVWDEFAQHVRDRGLPLSDDDFKKDRELIERQVKFEIVRRAKGRDAADLQSLQEDDDAVKRAIELIKVSAILKLKKESQAK